MKSSAIGIIEIYQTHKVNIKFCAFLAVPHN